MGKLIDLAIAYADVMHLILSFILSQYFLARIQS